MNVPMKNVDWKALFLLLGPLFYFSALMINQAINGHDEKVSEWVSERTELWLIVGLFFSIVSIAFLPSYFLNPHTKSTKAAKTFIVGLALSPVIFTFLTFVV